MSKADFTLDDVRIEVADLQDPAHGAALLTVLDTYASDPVGGGSPLPADVRERLIPMLRAHAHTIVLLAFVGETPAGLANCFQGLSTFAARPLLNIHDLAVIPALRGRGIGRRLLDAAEAIAVEHGCCKLTLEVQDDNRPARSLYRSFGFGDVTFGNAGPTRFLAKPLS